MLWIWVNEQNYPGNEFSFPVIGLRQVCAPGTHLSQYLHIYVPRYQFLPRMSFESLVGWMNGRSIYESRDDSDNVTTFGTLTFHDGRKHAKNHHVILTHYVLPTDIATQQKWVIDWSESLKDLHFPPKLGQIIGTACVTVFVRRTGLEIRTWSKYVWSNPRIS